MSDQSARSTIGEIETPRTDSHLAHLNLPDGRKVGIPNETVALLRQLERESEYRWQELRRRERTLESVLSQYRPIDPRYQGADPAAEYAKQNPLGGVASMFEAMARRLRAGEDYQSVLDDFGLQEAITPSSTEDSHASRLNNLLEAARVAEIKLRDGGTYPIKGETWRALRDALLPYKGIGSVVSATRANNDTCAACGGRGSVKVRDATDQDNGVEPCPQCRDA